MLLNLWLQVLLRDPVLWLQVLLRGQNLLASFGVALILGSFVVKWSFVVKFSFWFRGFVVEFSRDRYEGRGTRYDGRDR